MVADFKFVHSYKKEIIDYYVLSGKSWAYKNKKHIMCLQEIYDLEKEIKKQMSMLQCKKYCNREMCI